MTKHNVHKLFSELKRSFVSATEDYVKGAKK